MKLANNSQRQPHKATAAHSRRWRNKTHMGRGVEGVKTRATGHSLAYRFQSARKDAAAIAAMTSPEIA